MLRKNILYILIFCLTATVSHAYSISPIIIHLTPQGSSAKQAVDIINDSDEPIAIEVTVRERIIDAAGQDNLAEVNEKQQLFAIYPSQLVVKPNATRTVQVQYIGDKKLDKELAYKLIFEELKINFEKPNTSEQGGIDFLIKYQASLYVTPSNAKPNVIIKSITKSKDKDVNNPGSAIDSNNTHTSDGSSVDVITHVNPSSASNNNARNKSNKKKLLLTLENTGTAHKVMAIPQIMRGNVMVLDEKSLIGLMGGNLLPKGVREYEIEVENDDLLDKVVNLRFNS